jgi:chloramphenicol-sensitive protein RarD
VTEAAKGVLAMACACVIWGLSPIFYRLLADVPPLELLSHRTVWSLITFALVLLLQGRFRELGPILTTPRTLTLVALAGAMISVNWFLFILSTQINRVTESSLGYYMFPLVAVLLGMVFFGEKLRPLKAVAVALALIAVTVLTVGLGAAPWISLALAVTFGFYGVIKKLMAAGPVVTVTAEVILLSPVAIIWLAGVHGAGWSVFSDAAPGVFGSAPLETVLLMISGPLTAVPLMLFSYAARRIALATAGLVHYLNPTLQFACATIVFAEVPTHYHLIAFPIIWTALAIYSYDSWRQEKSARKASTTASTVSTEVT